MSDPVRLDIGCGANPVPGFVPVDLLRGERAYPLAAADGSVDEIRASHVLEHFSHTQVGAVLADWVRALKPGGLLRVAVPDFERIASAYLAGENIPIQGYVMGGHVDANDRHGCLFDVEALTEAMQAAGLLAVSRWTSEQRDCAALPISLNLQGTKPPAAWPKVAAVMSTPRLGWNDFWGCALETLGRLGIRLTKHTGAFWEQCITRGLIEAGRDNPAYLLTLDYDTIFSAQDVQTLLIEAMRHPEADAIAALQVHRSQPTPLMTVGGPEGNLAAVPFSLLEPALTKARTAHFGLTLLRADKLAALPRPWFHGCPDTDGDWSEARLDPDISFWRAWEAAGNSLYVANRVPVGHLEVMIRWPGRDIQAIWQHPNDYHADGKPDQVWQ